MQWPRTAAAGCLAAVVLCATLAAWAPSTATSAEPEVRRAVEVLRRFAKEPFEQKERARALRDLGRIGGEDAAAAILPIFRDPFVHLRDHGVSAWIAMVKGERGAETVSWLGTKALKDRNEEVREGAATALGFSKDPAAGEHLRRRVSRIKTERSPTVLVALLRAWARTEARLPDDALGLLTHKDGAVALAAAEAFAARDRLTALPPGYIREGPLGHRTALGRAAGVVVLAGLGLLDAERVQQILADPAEEPRIVLAERLAGEVPSLPWEDAGRALLETLLADTSWRVRATAIESAISRWRADVVPLLIERLPHEEGRLRLDLADALATLTGKALGADAELWRSWWQAQGADFDPGTRPRGQRPRRPSPAAVEDDETTTPTFFRLPIRSGRVAFLLDCSGSMRNAAIGADADGATKMDVARAELEHTLRQLAPETRFDVYLYRYPSEYPPRPKMTRAFGRLQACSSARAKAAVNWLASEEGKGWGAFSDALALLLAEDVDTVFFLSDGRPSRGRYDRDFRLITEFMRLNRFRRLVVHTALVGREKADRAFLEELAASTGGHFADATQVRR